MVDVRIFFQKKDAMRFTSHLDMNRAFTRALFASGLPVWFTEGFNRHPHLVFGQPLPLGMAGERETLDMRLTEEVDFYTIADRLNEQLPPGIIVISVASPVYPHKEIAFASYEISIDPAYKESFEQFWSMPSIIAKKKTKRAEIELDLKKEIPELTYSIKDGQFTINAIMPCSFECSIGPIVLIKAFEEFVGNEVFRYHTRKEFLLKDYSSFE